MVPYHWVLIALAACELRWRSSWLRVLLVILAVAEIQVAMGLGPAYRHSVANHRRVPMPAPPSQPETLASEYVSGVLVMDEAARRVLRRANFPLGIIIWLALYPVVIPAVTRRMRPTVGKDSTSAKSSPTGQ